MIASFGDQTTEDIYNDVRSKAARKINPSLWKVVQRKLDMLDAAISLNDLKSPGNQLEKLKGDRGGFWSIRVNDQYRVVFRYENGQASDVVCIDVH
ncbi:MAG TPA: type II toxin-antitoxin system RelE/ParE family toxin [Terriglobales bacterium]|nr:type II toxin-antitoxin system RelE/ParE family toxin [Terriglobales bacterium]